MVRVYADVVADLFHSGHINLFKQAREFGDYLVVGVHSDKIIQTYKRSPVMNERNRYDIVRQCRLVDEVIEDAPLIITQEFLEEHQIDIVVHGDDFEEGDKQHRIPHSMGIMRYVAYTKGISTTQIINKIKFSKKTNWREVWEKKADEQVEDLYHLAGWQNTNMDPRVVFLGIHSLLGISEADSILEVGCGPGLLSQYFDQYDYVGVDYVGRFLERHPVKRQDKLFQSEANNLPFEDAYFDWVFAYSVFHYFPSVEYAEQALHEMGRVSRKGIFIGDLPTSSHHEDHLLFSQGDFVGWQCSPGFYTEKRFNVRKVK